MKLDRDAGYLVIALLMLAAIAAVLAHLWGQHYYHMTYARCAGSDIQICTQWRSQAWLELLIVFALGAATLVWNARRYD